MVDFDFGDFGNTWNFTAGERQLDSIWLSNPASLLDDRDLGSVLGLWMASSDNG